MPFKTDKIVCLRFCCLCGGLCLKKYIPKDLSHGLSSLPYRLYKRYISTNFNNPKVMCVIDRTLSKNIEIEVSGQSIQAPNSGVIFSTPCLINTDENPVCLLLFSIRIKKRKLIVQKNY